VRATPTDHGARERSPAALTAAPIAAPVNSQRVLMSADFASCILKRGNGRAAVCHPLAQDGADGAMEPPHLLVAQGVGGAFGMESRVMERLIDVDIAQTGDQRLVKQHAFEFAGAASEIASQAIGGERGGQRLWPETVVEALHVEWRPVLDATKFALIDETQIVPIVELDREPFKAQGWGSPDDDSERAGHP
jgi:hypothetical protein